MRFFSHISFGLILLALYNCKKYPEDNKSSYNGVLNRLTSKSWKIEQYIVDGADSSNLLYRYPLYNSYLDTTTFISWYYTGAFFSFTTSDRIRKKGNCTVYTQNSIRFDQPANWDFYKGKDVININAVHQESLPGSTWLGPQQVNCDLFPVQTADWKILKLTDKEFIIENKSKFGKKLRVILK